MNRLAAIYRSVPFGAWVLVGIFLGIVIADGFMRGWDRAVGMIPLRAAAFGVVLALWWIVRRAMPRRGTPQK